MKRLALALLVFAALAPPVYRSASGGVLHPGVPEPATFATMLAGLAVVFVLAFGLRGRRGSGG